MELKIKDLIGLFNVTEKVILKWIKEKNLPSYKIDNEYFFNKPEINEWILKNNIAVSDKILDFKLTNIPVSLSNLIKKGGIFYNVMGNNPKELITNSINLINTPSNLSKEEIIYSLLQREDLMSTGIGKGIAIPHSRNPIIADIENECVALCFSENPIDYDAIDKIPVHSLFFVLSANPKRHLEILSKIVFLCQQEQFVFILDKKPTKESILDFIEKKESEWKK